MLRKPSATVPGAWVAHVVKVAAGLKVPPDRLVAGLAIKRRELADPEVRVPIETLVAIVERARKLTREPGIGVHLGLQTRATLWGNLGFATLSAPTMRTALELAVRYCHVVMPAIGLRLREDDKMAELILDEHTDFAAARDAIVLWILLGLWRIGRMMTGSASKAHLELALGEPEYMSRLRAGLPPLRFQQPANRLLFPTSSLDLPYVLHDPSALSTALEWCERQREALALEASVARRVRELLTRSRTLPAFKAVAAQLRVSPRTLSRRLGAEGSSYRALLEAERKRQGITLVSAHERSLAQIAARLGYSSVSNFERAFRRWTGHSPTQYRRASRAAAG